MRRKLLAPWTGVAVGFALAVAAVGFPAAEDVPKMRSADLPFLGTRWTLVQIGSETVAPGRAPSVRFGPTRAAGFDGCTTFFMDGNIDSTNIRLDPARSALAPVACPPGFTLPGAFGWALLRSVRASVDGDRMKLHGADGRVLATFRAMP